MSYGTEPARRGRTAIGGGRGLGWSEWGPEDGRPVLFSPGAATSSRLGFGDDVVEALGVRLIALDRPGLGASDPDPDRTLATWPRDVAALLDARGIGKPALVGYSQGAPFALACAAAGVGSALALVSPTDELAAMPERLHPDVAGIVRRVAEDPAGAEAWFGGMTAAAMRQMVLAMVSDADRAVYTDPSFASAYDRALEEAFAQGSAGYARDAVLAFGRWPFDPARVAVPTDVWYGGLDTSPVHSPDQGRSLAARIPGARHHLVPEAGGSLLWTHAGAILGG